MPEIPILDAEFYPEGWNEDRLIEVILKLARDPERTDLSSDEKMIAQLGYSLRKSKDAFQGVKGSAQRRKAEIERLTGEPMKALGYNRCRCCQTDFHKSHQLWCSLLVGEERGTVMVADCKSDQQSQDCPICHANLDNAPHRRECPMLMLVGEIREIKPKILPEGAEVAAPDGRALSRKDYPELYAIIKDRFGGGDRETFRLPDIRQSIPAYIPKGGSIPIPLKEFWMRIK